MERKTLVVLRRMEASLLPCPRCYANKIGTAPALPRLFTVGEV
jgi:hypothetical protein